MALVNSAFTVNVAPGAMPPIVHVSEYDVGRTYTVTINGENGGAFVIPTGASATIEGTLNGSVGFTQSATISNNQVSFALSESMTAYSGKAWCKIKLTLNNQPIQTCAFVLVVDRAGVEADTVIGADGFQEQINQAVAEYIEDSGLIIDSTLSRQGAAADAKATGDRLTALEEATIETDDTLTIEGAAADAKAVGDELAAFASNSVPSAIKAAIVALFKSAVYISPSQASNIRKLEKWAAGLPSKSDTESWASGVPYTMARITGEGASSSSGTIEPTSSYDRTDYGYCEGADYLYIPNEYNGSWAGAWFYDANKEYISPKITLGIYAPVPANAKYFVFYKSPSTFDTVANDIVPFDASDFEVGWSRGVAYSGLTLFPNQGLKYATGAIINAAGWSLTYYVNCEGVEYLKIPPAELNTSSDAVLYNWFYDSNKAPISRFAVSKTNDNYILVPGNAKYFILNFTTACMEDIVEKGIIPYMAEDLEQ